MTAPALCPLEDLAAAGEIALAVSYGYGVPGQCEWCGLAGAIAGHRIYGDPAPRHQHSIQLVEVCKDCAPTVVARVLNEQDEQSDRPILVEVAAR